MVQFLKIYMVQQQIAVIVIKNTKLFYYFAVVESD